MEGDATPAAPVVPAGQVHQHHPDDGQRCRGDEGPVEGLPRREDLLVVDLPETFGGLGGWHVKWLGGWRQV